MMLYSMKFAKNKAKIKNKISKNEGYLFRQHSLFEKSPTATDIYTKIVLYYQCRQLFRFSAL